MDHRWSAGNVLLLPVSFVMSNMLERYHHCNHGKTLFHIGHRVDIAVSDGSHRSKRPDVPMGVGDRGNRRELLLTSKAQSHKRPCMCIRFQATLQCTTKHQDMANAMGGQWARVTAL